MRWPSPWMRRASTAAWPQPNDCTTNSLRRCACLRRRSLMNEPSPRTDAALRLILLVLLVTEINSAFEVGMMYGILATLVREFGDPVGVGWLITAFLLVGAAAAALCSRLGDVYGRRRMIVVLLALAACGSLISALSSGLPGMIAGRALQGV